MKLESDVKGSETGMPEHCGDCDAVRQAGRRLPVEGACDMILLLWAELD